MSPKACHTEPHSLDGIRRGVILTGATGYLGCHILHELLTAHKEVSTIVCIVRGSSEQEARERLQSGYQHYFSASPFDDDAQVVVVDGDITDSQTFLRLLPLITHPSPLFIHCAADVRYFAPHQEIERTNIVGTRIVADFCLRHHVRLIHISTLSLLHANLIDSPYISSKAEAELLINERIGRGLNAQIVRIGFLAPRATDGMFQQHPDRSAFFLALQLFRQMGVYPASLQGLAPDVTPVDEAARRIVFSNSFAETIVNLTQPTPIERLLPHATPMADADFFSRLQRNSQAPFAALALLKAFFLRKK